MSGIRYPGLLIDLNSSHCQRLLLHPFPIAAIAVSYNQPASTQQHEHGLLYCTPTPEQLHTACTRTVASVAAQYSAHSHTLSSPASHGSFFAALPIAWQLLSDRRLPSARMG